MLKIRKKFKFETAHRLVSSYSTRCQSFHGHGYTVDLVLKGTKLNEDAMVIDFGEVKAEVGDLFDMFDHSMVLYDKDPFNSRMVDIMKEGNMRYLIVSYNPTAERMAQHFYKELKGQGYDVDSVKVHETLTGWAECSSICYDNLMFVEIGGIK